MNHGPKPEPRLTSAATVDETGHSPPPNGFIFVDSPADFRDSQAIVVRIPRGVSSKQKLFAILADKLHFPRYFGWNWDALEECLGDLSWLPAGRAVILVHEALPFGARGPNRQIYLDILRKLVMDVRSTSRDLSLVLPSGLRDPINPAATAPRQST